MMHKEAAAPFLHSGSESEPKKHKSFDDLFEKLGGFGPFQIFAVFVVNLGFVGGAPSILAGVFVASDVCTENTTIANQSTGQFYTVHDALGIPCSHRTYYKALLTGFLTLSMVISSATAGAVGDRLGRKPLLCASMLLLAGSNLVIGFSQSIVQIIIGATLNGAFIAPYIVVFKSYSTEFCPIQYRLLALCTAMFPVGMMVLGCAAYLTKNYRDLSIVIAIINFIVFCIMLFMPESPRFLIQQRKFTRAMSVLDRIARWNRVKLLPRDYDLSVYIPGRDAVKHASYRDLFRRPAMRSRVLALSYDHFAAGLTTCAIYFYIANIFGSPYVNMTITGALKLVAGLSPLVLERCIGRVTTLLIMILMTSICAWGTVLTNVITGVGHSLPITVLTLATASFLDPVYRVSGALNVELFPTVARSAARAICSVGSTLGAVIGPQILLLTKVHLVLPYAIIAAATVVQLFVVWKWLPETKGVSLPDNFED